VEVKILQSWRSYEAGKVGVLFVSFWKISCLRKWLEAMAALAWLAVAIG